MNTFKVIQNEGDVLNYEKSVIEPNEVDIKIAVLNWLREQSIIKSENVLANEYPIGPRQERADLAVLSDEFIGIEIKSNHDSLRRLELQISKFLEHFEKVYLFVGTKHASKLKSIQEEKLKVYVVTENQIIKISEDICSKQKKSQRTDCSPKIFEAKLGFSSRYKATSDIFWKSVIDRVIQQSDLQLLSRFHELRELAAKTKKINESQWDKWREYLNSQSTHSSSVS